MTPLKIAIAGLGTVGGAVARLLLTRKAELAERAGCPLQVTAVCARSRGKRRSIPLDDLIWVDDPAALVTNDVDVVIELIGGEDGAAFSLIETALGAGKSVVSANKALLAHRGAQLAALAERTGAALKFEAAAAGGIPIVKALRECFIAEPVHAVRGILNGTCNYILTEMEATGMSFAEVLGEAQRLGFAEADPSLDVGGVDTAHKLALLSGIAFGIKPNLGQISVQGIAHITPADIAFAREFGRRIKLLGIARMTPRGLDSRVRPAMVRLGTPLADVDGAFNAVVADCGEPGPYFFEGRGAGAAPTASSVIADLIDIARGRSGPAFGVPASALKLVASAPPETRRSAFYLRLNVLDEPGVLAEIAGHLAQAGVSIESMIQRGRSESEPIAIVMITHDSAEIHVARALKAIAASNKVLGEPCMIPMEA